MSSNDIALILALVSVGAALVLLTISYRSSLINTKQLEDTIFRGRKVKKAHQGVSKWLRVYHFYHKVPLLKNVVNKIYKQYTMIYPDDVKLARRKSAQITSFIVLGSTSAILLALLNNATIVTFAGIIVAIMIFGDSYIINRLNKEEINLLKEFNSFISEVRFHYMDTEMVDEAVYDSIEKCGKRAKPHAEKISEILLSDDVRDEATKYNSSISIPQIKTFLLILVTTMQYGDLRVNNQSLFLDNVKNITREINIEILLRNLKKASFAVADLICLLPIFCIEPLQNFSLGVMPELESFYYGTDGLWTTIGAFAVSLITHSIINVFKEMDKPYVSEHPILEKLSEIKIIDKILDNYESTRYSKIVKLERTLKNIGESLTPRLFQLKRMLIAVLIFAIGNVLFVTVHENSKTRIISSVANIENTVLTTTNDDLVAVLQSIPWYAEQYKGNTLIDNTGVLVSAPGDILSMASASSLVTMSGSSFDPSNLTDPSSVVYTNGDLTVSTIAELLSCDKQIKNVNTINAAAREIYARIEAYHNEYFKWYELLIILAISWIGYMTPVIKIVLCKGSLHRRMEDEVIQFQTIIMMIAFFERTSIHTILEWMEEFAIIFRDSITECLNKMNSGDEKALDDLIEAENFEMFTMLIENLKMSDKVGVSQAFNNIGITRENFQLTREQDTQLRVKRNSNTAQLLILAPTLFIIIAFLVMPYMNESTRQLNEALVEYEM